MLSYSAKNDPFEKITLKVGKKHRVGEKQKEPKLL